MADFELPQWVRDLQDRVEQACETIEREADEVAEYYSDCLEFWQGEFNEALAAYNEHAAAVEALEAKKEALVTFKSYLTQYEDTIGDLPSLFEGYDSCCFCNSSGLFRMDIYESLNAGYDPENLYNLGMEHINSHEDLIAIVTADISSLSSEISYEQQNMDWFTDVMADIREDARAAGYWI